MPTNMRNEDSRSMKTQKALHSAMLSLLKQSSFKKISIKGICEEALVSRATFYAHFVDKYDLLKHWMTGILTENINSRDTYAQIEKVVNYHMQENILVLKNLIQDADNETLGILFDCILSTMNINNENEAMHPKNVVLSHFYAGGMMSYFSWHAKNKFPSDIPPMNKYLYEMIQKLQD